MISLTNFNVFMRRLPLQLTVFASLDGPNRDVRSIAVKLAIACHERHAHIGERSSRTAWYSGIPNNRGGDTFYVRFGANGWCRSKVELFEYNTRFLAQVASELAKTADGRKIYLRLEFATVFTLILDATGQGILWIRVLNKRGFEVFRSGHYR
jgi:hypothetical protein